MDLLQRLESCKKCTKRKSSDTGIVCSLTLRKPDFLDTCKHFDVDPKEAQKMAVRTEYKEEEENSKSIWVYIGVGLLILKIIFRLLRD